MHVHFFLSPLYSVRGFSISPFSFPDCSPERIPCLVCLQLEEWHAGTTDGDAILHVEVIDWSGYIDDLDWELEEVTSGATFTGSVGCSPHT